jgi:hypothetical protein
MDLKKRENNLPAASARNKKNILRVLAICCIAAIVIAGYWASGSLKKKGYSGLFDFGSTVVSNYFDGFDAKPEELSIEISGKDYKKLEKNRKQALERGVIVNDLDGDYVPAVIQYKGKKINVKLRLKGHMTDHLQNEKWSFRVKIKEKDESVMGMKRFSLQHPGTRGYIYEWIYHELMKREDVIALRYKFINLSVNGRDWGIYALEENFENELIDNNARVVGPVLRFNPDLYWIKRYSGITKTVYAEEYASYFSANPEAYREDKVLQDTVQKRYYLKAIALIEGLRNKSIQPEVAFDIPRLAKFHAVVDLVGGTHSIDWSDIKYYYNPVTSKLEPVAYESFTVLGSKELTAQFRYVETDSSTNYSDWHSMLFSNKFFFKEYIKNLQRIAAPAYLDKFFDDSNEELRKNLAIIYKEFPYKKFDKEEYYIRQAIIRKILAAPKSIHAYLEKAEKKELDIQIGAIDALPVEIHSVKAGPVTLFPAGEIILPSKQAGAYVSYKSYRFHSDHEINTSWLDSLKVIYSVPGLSEKRETAVFLFPHTDIEFIAEDIADKKGNISSFDFLIVDEKEKLIRLKQGKYVLDKDLVIPGGYSFMVNAGVLLEIKNNAMITSWSPVGFFGTEDEPIVISSGDSTFRGIELLQTGGESQFRNVIFRSLPLPDTKRWKRTGSITCYESPVKFSSCIFNNCKAEDAVSLIRSPFSFSACLFSNMENDALDIDFSDGEITNCAFEQCLENALDITMSKVSLRDINIKGAKNRAIIVKAGSRVKGSRIKIMNSGIGIAAEDFSFIEFTGDVRIENTKTGIVAYRNKPGAGDPSVTISGLHFENVARKSIKEKKSIIKLNGSDDAQIIENIEKLLKSEKN